MAQLTDKQIERANGMNPPAREILLGDRLKNITDEGVVQVPVPDADSTANAYMEDVIGNKEDAADQTADTASLVALIRQLLEDNGVPSADAAANIVASDVIGNKTDTISGGSLISLLKLSTSDYIICGTAVSGSATSIGLDSNASSTPRSYDPGVVLIVSGTGAGQSRQIWEYDHTSKVAYVGRDWVTNPSTDSEYCILSWPGDTHVNEGKAQAGGTATITLNSLASSVNNVYRGQIVFVTAGSGADQAKMITDYNGSTKVATVDSNWDDAVDSTSMYAIYPWPGYIFAAPSADRTTGVLSRDVIGNKSDAASDTTDEASLVALARYNRKEIVEVEHHLHNYERWMGALSSPTGETDIASNDFTAAGYGVFAVSTGASAYQYGSWVQILGSNDTPVIPGMAKFDLHRIEPDGGSTSNSVDFRIQIAFGGDTDGSSALATGDYTEFPYWENTQTQQQPIAIMTKRWAAGTKVWARAASVQSGPNTFSFWYGMHEYDE